MFPSESTRRCSDLHDDPALPSALLSSSKRNTRQGKVYAGKIAGGTNKTRIGEVRGRQINLRFFPRCVLRVSVCLCLAAPPPPPFFPIQPSSFFFWPRRRVPENTHACLLSVGKVYPVPPTGFSASNSHVSGFIERGRCHYFRDYRVPGEFFTGSYTRDPSTMVASEEKLREGMTEEREGRTEEGGFWIKSKGETKFRADPYRRPRAATCSIRRMKVIVFAPGLGQDILEDGGAEKNGGKGKLLVYAVFSGDMEPHEINNSIAAETETNRYDVWPSDNSFVTGCDCLTVLFAEAQMKPANKNTRTRERTRSPRRGKEEQEEEEQESRRRDRTGIVGDENSVESQEQDGDGQRRP
ncbi:hypothetical protein WH47_08155 [Habropoda laboriosa]|uniref:Uncharacterized protein n=1 Tax=Habropoda laboriosa TaxID=597456 RepID=A0A0L7QNG0_9HYME|nr:hypothetical protein WH47_08155 [Habropoda laboriosa]